MRQDPMISVIVPIYNVEPYLDKCIGSIVNQSYKNLEIILVDDGSPDRCPEICDQWATRDNRIRVIHKENGGGGSARNAGLDVATGELIAFVDSDDYVSEDMLGHLCELLASGADIAECDFVEVADDNADFSCGDKTVCKYAAQEAMAEHIRDRVFRQLIWNKLYRREVIGDIRFPVGKSIDDEFFTYRVLGNAKTLIHSEKICYAYRQQEKSVMHAMGAQKRLQGVEAKILRHNYIRESYPELVELSLKNLWFTCIYQGQLSQRELEREACNRNMTCLQEILAEYPCKRNECTVQEKIWLLWAAVSLKTVCRMRNILGIGL